MYNIVSPIISVILASLKPLKFRELFTILQCGEELSEKEFNQRFNFKTFIWCQCS